MLIFKSRRSSEDSVPGLVTIVNWTMAPDGQKYLYFWSQRWQVITDSDIPAQKFRSTERWQLIAVSHNADVLAVFPGCQVKAWIRCLNPPATDCYVFDPVIETERQEEFHVRQ